MCRSVATPSIGGGTISEADVGGHDICLLRCECHLDRAAGAEFTAYTKKQVSRHRRLFCTFCELLAPKVVLPFNAVVAGGRKVAQSVGKVASLNERRRSEP
jgi:hypothetical protein